MIFCFQTMYLSNVMFELEFNRGRTEISEGDEASGEDTESVQAQAGAAALSPEPGTRNILLKGQMKYIDDIKAIVFLCSPV